MGFETILSLLFVLSGSRIQKLVSKIQGFVDMTPEERLSKMAEALFRESKMKSMKLAEGVVDEAYKRSSAIRRLVEKGKL